MRRNRDGIEILDVPPAAYSVAENRMKSFVRHTTNCAQFGNLNLMQLACSAYLQGAYDAYEGLESIKEQPPRIIPANCEWWPV